jgi:hypothetical protein
MVVGNITDQNLGKPIDLLYGLPLLRERRGTRG